MWSGQRRSVFAFSAASIAGDGAGTGLLADAVLVAANIAFDAAFIEAFLRRNGHAPAWNYHLVEIESMATTTNHGIVTSILGQKAGVLW